MSTVLDHPEIDLVDADFHAFNCAVWDRLCSDRVLAALDYRIETDRHGQIVMSSPSAPSHGSKKVKLGSALTTIMASGEVISECPISTREGVKAADVAWCSDQLWAEFGQESCFKEAPEICVEILSPSNTKGEIEEKKSLYFSAGAKEVWICDEEEEIEYLFPGEEAGLRHSKLCPDFPKRVG